MGEVFKISVRAYRGVGEIRTFIKNNIYKKVPKMHINNT